MPREKTMKVVFAFPTTTMAMKMEAAAKAKTAPGRLIPVPRQISAGCGMAWCAPVADRAFLEQLIDAEHIVTEGCYELLMFSQNLSVPALFSFFKVWDCFFHQPVVKAFVLSYYRSVSRYPWDGSVKIIAIPGMLAILTIFLHGILS